MSCDKSFPQAIADGKCWSSAATGASETAHNLLKSVWPSKVPAATAKIEPPLKRLNPDLLKEFADKPLAEKQLIDKRAWTSDIHGEYAYKLDSHHMNSIRTKMLEAEFSGKTLPGKGIGQQELMPVPPAESKPPSTFTEFTPKTFGKHIGQRFEGITPDINAPTNDDGLLKAQKALTGQPTDVPPQSPHYDLIRPHRKM